MSLKIVHLKHVLEISSYVSTNTLKTIILTYGKQPELIAL